MKRQKRGAALILCMALACTLAIPVFAGNGFMNDGTFINSAGATFNNQGTFDNTGTITNNGSFNNSGTLVDNGTWNGTAPSGKSKLRGAVLTGLRASGNADTLSFWPIYIGSTGEDDSSRCRLDFVKSDGSTALTLQSTQQTQDQGNGTTSSYWDSPRVAVNSSDWKLLLGAASVTVIVSDSSGSALTTMPFALQTSTTAVDFTAAAVKSGSQVEVTADFGRTLPEGTHMTLSCDANDGTTITQSAYVHYSDSTSGWRMTLWTDAVSLAEDNALTVTAEGASVTSTTDSSTKKLTVTHTAYTGSTTAVYSDTGADGSIGTNGYGITFKDSSNILMFTLSAPSSSTASYYGVDFCTADGVANDGIYGLPSDAENTDISPIEGTYTTAKIYASDESGTKGTLLAEVPINLVVQTNNELTAPTGLTVKRSAAKDTYGEYTYYVSGSSYSSDTAYVAKISPSTGDYYYNMVYNYARSHGNSPEFWCNEEINSVGICAQTCALASDGSCTVSRSVPYIVTSIETLAASGYSLSFSVNTKNQLEYSFSASDTTGTAAYWIKVREAGTNDNYHDFIVNASISENQVFELDSLVMFDREYRPSFNQATVYQVTSSGTEPVAEFSIPRLTVTQDRTLPFPAVSTGSVKVACNTSLDSATLQYEHQYVVTGLTDESYTYHLADMFGGSYNGNALSLSKNSSTGNYTTRVSDNNSSGLTSCSLAACKASGDATNGFTITWTQDLVNVPIDATTP